MKRALLAVLVALAFPASAIGAPHIDGARAIQWPDYPAPQLGNAVQVNHLAGHEARINWLYWPAPKMTPSIYRALYVAREYWGREPAHCREVRVEVMGEYRLPLPVLGVASIAPKRWRAEMCNLWLREEYGDPANWTKACTVTIHEWGHLLGYEHVVDRFNIMYPLYVPTIIPEVCKGG